MNRFATLTAVFSLAGVSAAAVVAAAGPGTTPTLPDVEAARGLVFDGLRDGGSSGPCAGGFEIEVAGDVVCTHGPDAAEDGIDVRTPRSVAELKLSTLELPSVAGGGIARAQQGGNASNAAAHVHADGSVHDHGIAAGTTDGSATAAETGIVPVIGDGVSGNRVQAVYVVAADRPDRYAEVAPLIANWAAHVDAMLDASAALTGGERHVRFVTNPDGTLNVLRVVLPAEADDSFGNTINAMKAAGFGDPSRKYLMWTDASLYCGIGTIYGDDKPTQDNYNNGRFPMYSRVDTGCWGKSNSVELHEIVHNMGGVQQSSPNVTPGWHCTDDYDRMCYRDASTVTMTYDCPSWMEAYLDCGHDDYFHTAPPAGSYLDQHWNVADSSFLHVGPPDGGSPPPPPTNTAPVVTIEAPTSTRVGDAILLDGTVTDDGLGGLITVSWTASGPGTVTFANAGAVDTTASFSSAGTYQLTLTARDSELSGSATVTITVTAPVVNAAPSVSVSAPSTIVLGDGAALDGTVSDDGVTGGYTVDWTAAGPGSVTFADPTAVDTSATFSAAGTYQLTLTADDGELTGSATVSITVEAPPVNEAPSVAASATPSLALGKAATLDGWVVDDGRPGPYTVRWTASGPGAVTFDNATAENTSATFAVAGDYVFTLTADDGELTGSASVTVTVTEPEPTGPVQVTETVTGSLNKKWTSRSFSTTVADGPVSAIVVVADGGGGSTKGGGGRGKKDTSAAETTYTLSLHDAAGGLVVETTGAGPLEIDSELAAGTYTWEVAGTSGSFELTLTYLQ